jgi:hypothetical protein
MKKCSSSASPRQAGKSASPSAADPPAAARQASAGHPRGRSAACHTRSARPQPLAACTRVYTAGMPQGRGGAFVGVPFRAAGHPGPKRTVAPTSTVPVDMSHRQRLRPSTSSAAGDTPGSLDRSTRVNSVQRAGVEPSWRLEVADVDDDHVRDYASSSATAPRSSSTSPPPPPPQTPWGTPTADRLGHVSYRESEIDPRFGGGAKDEEVQDDGEDEAAKEAKHQMILRKQMRTEKVKELEGENIRYGEIFFEETNRRVPYLIVPDNEYGNAPANVVSAMVRHMRHNGDTLSRPEIQFRVRGRCDTTKSYMDFARQIHANPVLADAWGWRSYPQLILKLNVPLLDSGGVEGNELVNQQGESVLDVVRTAIEQCTGLWKSEGIPEPKEHDDFRMSGLSKVPPDGSFRGKKDRPQVSSDGSFRGKKDRPHTACCYLTVRFYRHLDLGEKEKTDGHGNCHIAIKDVKDLLKNCGDQIAEKFQGSSFAPPGSPLGSEKTTLVAEAEPMVDKLEKGVYKLDPNGHIYQEESLDHAIRECGDRMLEVFGDVVRGVVAAKGWLMNPMGRGAKQQLIGDAIERFGGDCEEAVWVQYASLHNPGLGGVNHEKLKEDLLRCAVNCPRSDDQLPEVERRVFYPTERSHYPTPSDVQGMRTMSHPDDEKNKVSVAEWLKAKCDQLQSTALPSSIHETQKLHPRATHLIFYEQRVFTGKGKNPWNSINMLHDYLDEQGVSQAVMLVNGSHRTFEHGRLAVARSFPVMALKSVGGASELLAQKFEEYKNKKQSVKDSRRWKNPVSMLGPYDDNAIDPHLKESITFSVPPQAESRELIVVDVTNPSAGKEVSINMAEMLTMVGDEMTRSIGYNPAERDRITAGWDKAALYLDNANKERRKATLLAFALLFLNFAVVFIVVIKQQLFPKAASSGCDEIQAINSDEHMDVESYDKVDLTGGLPQELSDVLQLSMLVLPIIHGIFLTFNNAFAPLEKYFALRWASASVVSHIYQYRARACRYSAINTAGWTSENAGSRPGSQGSSRKTPPHKSFGNTLKNISENCAQNGPLQSSSLVFHNSSSKREDLLEAQPGGSRQWLVDSQQVEIASGAPDQGGWLSRSARGCCSKRRPGYQIFQTQEEDDKGISDHEFGKSNEPPRVPFGNNGYSILTAHEYLACRTKPGLEIIRARLPTLGRRQAFLNAVMTCMNAVSVLFGTVELDLYIAVSTAGISFIAGVLDYLRLQVTVVTLNRSATDLDQLIDWWNGLSFVERRSSRMKDKLVQDTERALMAEHENFFKPSHNFDDKESALEGGGDAGKEKDDAEQPSTQSGGSKPH